MATILVCINSAVVPHLFVKRVRLNQHDNMIQEVIDDQRLCLISCVNGLLRSLHARWDLGNVLGIHAIAAESMTRAVDVACVDRTDVGMALIGMRHVATVLVDSVVCKVADCVALPQASCVDRCDARLARVGVFVSSIEAGHMVPFRGSCLPASLCMAMC